MKTIRSFAGLGWAAALLLTSGCVAGLEEAEETSSPERGSSQDALSGVNAAGENLGGANLGGSNLGGANLGGANLGGTNLGGTNLGGTNLGGTNLGGNNLGGNNLGGTNLGGTNLGGTNLGGTNLGGTNLGGSNLSGSNLAGAYAGMGCPVAGTSRLGTDLALSTVATDIHNLGATATNRLTRSGEDVYSKNNACVVLGIGSTAFAKLVNQNLSGATMYAALRALPWGFTPTSGGAVQLTAWEVVVWGSSKYSVFIIAAPPSSTYAGVAGFIKAIFRWNAPTTMSIKIGQIGGGQTVQTHTGMMNAQAQLLSGAIDHPSYVAGQLAFAAATTNNISVKVDFASWIGRKTTNDPIILGRPEPRLGQPDAVYSVVLLDNGDVGVYASPFGKSRGTASTAYQAWKAGVSGKPSAKRCYGAVLLNRDYAADYPTPSDKCDSFALTHLKNELAMLSLTGDVSWSTDETSPEYWLNQESPDGTPSFKLPVTTGVLGCGPGSSGYASDYFLKRNYCMKLVLGQTYVHFMEPPYSVIGEGGHLSAVGKPTKVSAGTPTSFSVEVTNVGTVAGTSWTVEVAPNAPGQLAATPPPQTVSGLAVGATRTLTFTVTPLMKAGWSILLKKGSTALAFDSTGVDVL